MQDRIEELKEKASEIEEETGKVRGAILDYAKREHVVVIRGSDRKVRVKFDEKLESPGKSEAKRQVIVHYNLPMSQVSRNILVEVMAL